MSNGLNEECGVFGIYSNEQIDAAVYSYSALFALQHRGQESCGIAVNDDGVITNYSDIGLVGDVFKKDELRSLGKGSIAIGHCRYSPRENISRANCQPLVIRHIKGPMTLAHNGSLTNGMELRESLENEGAIFQSTGEIEVLAHLITKERLTAPSIEVAVERALTKVTGAYCLILMSAKKLIAARDPHGFRPLCMGKTETGYVFASESCAIDAIGAEHIRDIMPGEIVVVDENGPRSITSRCGEKTSLCVFEYVYFARPDSIIDGSWVNEARKRSGAFLAESHPVDADVVIGVPDSGLDAAIGYSEQSGIPYGIGLIKNKYIGRTFTLPTKAAREASVRIKLNPVASVFKGKRVVLIDDSIVRGTTSKKIVKLIRDAGAKEVHMRISSPPFLYPCYFGTDVADKAQLIACRLTVDEIAKELGADSLGYLRIEDVERIAEGSNIGFCTGCFTGIYPIETPKEIVRSKFDQKISESQKG